MKKRLVLAMSFGIIGGATTAYGASAVDVFQSFANSASAGGTGILLEDNLYVYDTDQTPSNGEAFSAVFDFQGLGLTNLIPPLNNNGGSSSTDSLGISAMGIASGTLVETGVGTNVFAVTNFSVDVYTRDSVLPSLFVPDSSPGAKIDYATKTTTNGTPTTNFLNATFAQVSDFIDDGNLGFVFGDTGGTWILNGNTGQFALGIDEVVTNNLVPGFRDPVSLSSPPGGTGILYGSGSIVGPNGGQLGSTWVQFDGDFGLAAIPTPAAAAPAFGMIGLMAFKRRRKALRA